MSTMAGLYLIAKVLTVLTFLMTIFYLIYLKEKVKEDISRECVMLYEEIVTLQKFLGEPLYGVNLFEIELEQYSKSRINISWFRDRLERHKATLLDLADRKLGERDDTES